MWIESMWIESMRIESMWIESMWIESMWIESMWIESGLSKNIFSADATKSVFKAVSNRCEMAVRSSSAKVEHRHSS